MRRKLIKQDAFDKITNESVTTAERELIEASPILAKALGKDLSLRSFTESTVVFQTPEDTYVHAGYGIKDGNIDFTNVEELVIDETTRKGKIHSILSEMLDAVVQDNHAKAKDLFDSYLGTVRWSEHKPNRSSQKRVTENNQSAGRKTDILQAAKTAGKDVYDAYTTAQNVLEYVQFMKFGPTLAESVVKTDEKGNVTDIRLPVISERNKSRLLRLDYRTPATKLHDTRGNVVENLKNQEFCKAIANLKRQNAFSDAQALEETLDHIVKNWPDLIYLTQDELAKVIGEALEIADVSKNYDDQTCEFMAEGILRTAHAAYTEKVAQILHMAGAPKVEENQDAYEHFASVVEKFYPSIDEKFGLERQAFADMYESLVNMYRKVERHGDEGLKQQIATQVNELAAVLNGELKPDLNVIEEAATWLCRFVESNIEGASQSWSVSNKPHLTINGDHPDMAKKAKVPGIPGKFEGDWGDEAPAIGQDSMSYKGGKHAKTMRHDSWGQEGKGGDVFPKLRNPYVPKPFGDYTMKGEKGVDKDPTGQFHSTWQSKDTWPDLQNPYVPKEAGGPGGKGHKMKNGKETDLIVDK